MNLIDRWQVPDAICAVCGDPAVWPREGKFGMGCRLHAERPRLILQPPPVVEAPREEEPPPAPRGVGSCPQRRNKRQPKPCKVCSRRAMSHGLCPRDDARRRLLNLPTTVTAYALLSAWNARIEQRKRSA